MSDYINYANQGQFAADPSASYNNIFKTDFGGKLPTQAVQGAPSYDLKSANDQLMLGATLGAGHAGADLTGASAFLGAYNPYKGQDEFGRYRSNVEPLKGLAAQIGYDTSGYNLDPMAQGGKDAQQLYADLNDKLKNYHYISGMSGGWQPTGDVRQAARTLYLDDGTGKLNPVTAPVGYHAKETGNWFQENQDAVMAALVLGGGFLGGTALAGMGAGAGGAAGITAAEGAGATGTAAGAGSGGLGGTLGSLQGWYAGLPAWGQGALSGAAQGGISSALQGQNPLKGAGIGALTGGLGGWGGSALAGATGMPSWAARGIVSAGTGGLGAGLSGGDWKRGALAGGLGSLAGSALSSTGLNSTLAGRLGGLAGSYGANSLLGGVEGGSRPTGMSGGGIARSGTAAAAPTGLSGGWRHMPTQGEAGNAMFARAAGEPMQQEAAQAALIERFKDDPEFLAKLREEHPEWA